MRRIESRKIKSNLVMSSYIYWLQLLSFPFCRRTVIFCSFPSFLSFSIPPTLSFLFYFTLFYHFFHYFILFYFVLCSVLFCSVLFCSVLLCSVVFSPVLLCSVLLYLFLLLYTYAPQSSVRTNSSSVNANNLAASM